jgi:hypothetical protein
LTSLELFEEETKLIEQISEVTKGRVEHFKQRVKIEEKLIR